MANGIKKWLRTQGTVPWIGEFKETLAQVLWWGTIVNFAMIAITFYFTTLRFIVPWFEPWMFIVAVAVGTVVIYVVEYKFIVPSIWAFRSRQMTENDSQVTDRLDRIERMVMKGNPNGIRVAVSGGFDPIHPGHTRHIRAAMALGDWVIVILSTDEILARKRNNGKAFMPYWERKEVIESILDGRGEVVPNVDLKGITCADALRLYKPDIFAKGGDTWNEDNLPEMAVCHELGIKVVFGVGGNDKIEASSKLIAGVK